MAEKEYRYSGPPSLSLRVLGLVLSIVVLVGISGLAGTRHGWRLGLLRCAVVDGGYLCGANRADTLVLAPGYYEGRTLLGPDVGWLSLMSALVGLKLGVVDVQAADLLQATRAFIETYDAESAIGFSLGGRATLSLAEEGLLERAAVVCTPTDLADVVARFSTLTARFGDAGVSGPDPRLREDFDAWRSVYFQMIEESLDLM